jgi:hypothetical protein
VTSGLVTSSFLCLNILIQRTACSEDSFRFIFYTKYQENSLNHRRHGVMNKKTYKLSHTQWHNGIHGPSKFKNLLGLVAYPYNPIITPIISATQEVKIGGFQFETSPGKSE